MAMAVNVSEIMRKNLNDDVDILKRKVSDLTEKVDERNEGIISQIQFMNETYNKTQERFEAIEQSLKTISNNSNIDFDISDELNKIRNDISELKSNSEPNELVENDYVHEMIPSDETFWTKIYCECTNGHKNGPKKTKVDYMTKYASQYGYGEQFWNNVLTFIFTSRKAGKKASEVGTALNKIYHIDVPKPKTDSKTDMANKIDKIDKIESSINDIYHKLSEMQKKVTTKNVSEPIESVKNKGKDNDIFSDALKASGVKILKVMEVYTVEDATGKSYDISIERRLE